MTSNETAINIQDKKHIKMPEFIAYLVAVFFYTNMTGMVGSYRNAYLVDVLKIKHRFSMY